MPAFADLLARVAGFYREERDSVRSQNDSLRGVFREILPPVPPAGTAITREPLELARQRLAANFDPRHGGFGHAPKFPHPASLEFLLREAGTQPMALLTLRRMAEGGIFDQLGGGFSRYSVDPFWMIPHFEKMLYDNGALLALLADASVASGDTVLREAALATAGWALGEMRDPGGAFYAALDADSEGEEGKFYVWTRAEVMEILGEEEGRIFCGIYDVTDRGNWEDKNILNVPREPEVGTADLAARGKCKLYGAREKRVRPGRDEKILSGWNGWMLAAFAEASLAFGRYEDVVRRNADFLLTRIVDGRLTRHAKFPGLLEDYAGVAWGLSLAYEATGERVYLDRARELADAILARFRDEEHGGFFDTPIDHEKLITRPKDLFDNATPGGTSVACEVLLRLALLFANEEYARVATEALESVWPLADKYPSGFGFLLGVCEWRAGQPKEIAITGDAAELRRVVGETYLPHRVLVTGAQSADLPLMENRTADKTLAYVCVGYACEEPTADAERLRELLSSAS
jgi:uncharacterized protein YyaL (SSP411 family)